MKNVKKYCADFETTSSKFYKKHNRVEVWLWGITRWNPKNQTPYKRFKTGTTMDSFLEQLSSLPNGSTVFFHNLSWDGYFLLCNIQFSDIVSDFSYLMSPSLKIYTMTIEFNGKTKIKFQCTAMLLGYISIDKMGKILGRPKLDIEYDRESYPVSKQDIDYLKRDIQIMVDYMNLEYNNDEESRFRDKRIQLTVGSYTKKYFMRKLRPWKHNFLWKGHLSVEQWDNIYNYSLFGGLSVYKGKYKDQILGKAIYYDINSSYPDKYINQSLPWGEPMKEKPKGQSHKLIFIRIFRATKLDLEMPDHLHSKTHSMRKARLMRYFKDYSGDSGFTIAYWNFEWVEILKTYEIEYKIIDTMYFASTWAMQKPGLKLYEQKEHAKTEVEAKNIKDKLNNWYGKMGQKRKQYNVECIDYANMEFQKTPTYETDTEKLSYVPVASIIAARGRVQLLKAIRLNKKNWVYSDTDSMILLGEEKEHKGLEIHKTKLGAWDIENRINKFKYLRSKSYYLYTEKGRKFVNAGLNNYHPENLPIEEFTYGFGVTADEGVKTAKKRYNTGYVLEYTKWTIGEKPLEFDNMENEFIIGNYKKK